MRTIALRFSDNFAPEIGTIAAHQSLIDQYGYVWYGKLGLPVSDKAVDYIFRNDNPRILLIHSGTPKRYWAYIKKIQRICPPNNEIPEYYRDAAINFHTWFQVTSFESAEKDVLSKYKVLSSGKVLSSVSRNSMSPFFIIESGGV